jgi:hypothetical protein
MFKSELGVWNGGGISRVPQKSVGSSVEWAKKRRLFQQSHAGNIVQSVFPLNFLHAVLVACNDFYQWLDTN